MATLDLTSPLENARYILAFHHNSCVRMIGFPEEEPAKDVYDAISICWAKVLTDQQLSKVCAVSIQDLFFLTDSRRRNHMANILTPNSVRMRFGNGIDRM